MKYRFNPIRRLRPEGNLHEAIGPNPFGEGGADFRGRQVEVMLCRHDRFVQRQVVRGSIEPAVGDPLNAGFRKRDLAQ